MAELLESSAAIAAISGGDEDNDFYGSAYGGFVEDELDVNFELPPEAESGDDETEQDRIDDEEMATADEVEEEDEEGQGTSAETELKEREVSMENIFRYPLFPLKFAFTFVFT